MSGNPVFDAIRRVLGRSFQRDEVRAIDSALGHAAPRCPEPQPGPLPRQSAPQSAPQSSAAPPTAPRADNNSRPRIVGARGVALIKRYEGCARLRRDGLVEAYPDPGTGADPWTIGWGATGRGIGPGTVWTQQQCDDRLTKDLERFAAGVRRAIGNAPTTQAQFDALVSFHYNTGAIARATLTKRHCAGDYAAAIAEFARWNRAGGRVLKGLIRRRQAEAQLYADPE